VKPLRRCLSLALPAALTATAAHAQNLSTWVSALGDDGSPSCSRAAPCRNFAVALSKTTSGGEISAIDPGGYGMLTITKSITINGIGTYAGILNTFFTGIVVSAGAEDRVVLRNLAIRGAGTSNGVAIAFMAGRHLTLENVAISGFTLRGIDFSAGVSNGSTVGMHLRNVRITKAANNTSSPTGIFIRNSPGPGVAAATLEEVTLSGLTNGLEVGINGRATVRNSVISGNKRHGILASHLSARIDVEGSQIAFNELTGVNAAVSGATIRLANNEIYNNTNGIAIGVNGIVSSAGNNRVAGNTSSAPPNGGAVPLQ
jgi:hypothetical protein